MRASAHAKINLGLVVGSRREDGRHELVTVLQAVELADELSVEPADAPEVTGFAGDTIVSAALRALARAVGTERGWRVRIEKQIPVAAGLGGGSSDAATALQHREHDARHAARRRRAGSTRGDRRRRRPILPARRAAARDR